MLYCLITASDNTFIIFLWGWCSLDPYSLPEPDEEVQMDQSESDADIQEDDDLVAVDSRSNNVESTIDEGSEVV